VFRKGINMARKVAFRKKRQNKLGMLCVGIVVLAVFSVIMIKSVELKNKIDAYEAEKTALSEQIDAEEKRKKDLEEYEKYTKTDRYIEEIAKEKLGLVYEDEIIFKSGIQDQ